MQVPLGVASVPAGVPGRRSRAGVSQRSPAGARRRGEARGVPGEPKSERTAGTHIQETRQAQEAARDPPTGLGTGSRASLLLSLF